MNADPAALTVRTDRRVSQPRRAFASFFQAEITLERRKKERTNQCQTDNMPVGGTYCEMRSKSRGECWKLTPHSTITASGMLCLRSNNASGATCSPAH